ncbi:diguanylate cyclase (GGDEF) domain-containing protein [Geodermatophilus africanus]|uniref:Diguanylate cyclase (GGDEF) domain-containing protein n=1 Tax=Geodermatophilus africanus TaxID=1137993 RepID=A0A1H3QR68_9ACTN|nr:GGDEF domain-containing protein [Geodermatophilus africanus]SDZ15830.1 diguanylate cyclase (GGDEF) domain-containing protein [Geodermatophilus africanus]
MRFPDPLRAREPRASAHSIVLIMGVSTVVLALLTTFGPNSVSSATKVASWAGVAALVATIAVCVLVPAERLDRAGAFPLIGLGGVLLTCVLNVLTDDPSAGAQAFLAFPVLWAASHLRWAAVALVTGAAVVGDGVTQLVLQPVEPAVHDALVVGTVLVVAAVILVRAASMRDGLLQRQADVDPLTGLVTRRVLDDALTGALEREPTGDGTALVLLDVDSFKQINDAHGHPVGDDALVHLSGLVRRQVRAGDAVVGRLGGDELALLLPGCTAEIAGRRAHELLEAVRRSPLPRADGGPLPLSISVGVAHAPLHAASVRELYAAADAALYEAKRAGRDRVEVAVSPVPGPARGLPRQRSAP